MSQNPSRYFTMNLRLIKFQLSNISLKNHIITRPEWLLTRFLLNISWKFLNERIWIDLWGIFRAFYYICKSKFHKLFLSCLTSVMLVFKMFKSQGVLLLISPSYILQFYERLQLQRAFNNFIVYIPSTINRFTRWF